MGSTLRVTFGAQTLKLLPLPAIIYSAILQETGREAVTSLVGKEDLESGLGSNPSVLYEVSAFVDLSPDQCPE